MYSAARPVELLSLPSLPSHAGAAGAIQRRLQYLREKLRNIGSASSNSKVIEESLNRNRIRVFRGNPEDYDDALPTALICEPAGNIVNIFSGRNDKPPSSESLATVSILSREMRQFYGNDDERADAFVQQLSNFISFTKSGHASTSAYNFRSEYGPVGFREKSLAMSNKVAVSMIIDEKREMGTRGDPTMQICLDYAATAGKMSWRNIDGYFPCLLVTVSGVIVTVQLGVVGEYAQVEFLGCHSLRSADIYSGAQLIMAIKEAVQIIEDYYDKDVAEVESVDAPYPRSFNTDDFCVTVEYRQALKKGGAFVYEVAVTDGDYRRLLPSRLVINLCAANTERTPIAAYSNSCRIKHNVFAHNFSAFAIYQVVGKLS